MAHLVELGELWVCLEPLGLVWFGWEGKQGLRTRKKEKEEEGRRRESHLKSNANANENEKKVK